MPSGFGIVFMKAKIAVSLSRVLGQNENRDLKCRRIVTFDLARLEVELAKFRTVGKQNLPK